MIGRDGWEVAYGKCVTCGRFAGSLFSDGRTIWWAGMGVCDHAPHERPEADDPRVRRALSKAERRGHQ